MAQPQMDQAEIDLANWLPATFGVGQWQQHLQTRSNVYNCFAYAVGITNRRILPPNIDTLRVNYALIGWYEVDLNEAPSAGDCEVYARATQPGVPLHAHRVVAPKPVVDQSDCQSKMGEDSIISHKRAFLQNNHPNQNTSEYGTVRYRFRYNAHRLAAQQAETIKTTSSGRSILKKDANFTTSGGIYARTDLSTTRSGMVYDGRAPAPTKAEMTAAAKDPKVKAQLVQKQQKAKQAKVDAAHAKYAKRPSGTSPWQVRPWLAFKAPKGWKPACVTTFKLVKF